MSRPVHILDVTNFYRSAGQGRTRRDMPDRSASLRER